MSTQKRRLRSFDNQGFKFALSQGVENSIDAIALKNSMRSFDNLSKLEYINSHLTRETGIKNPTMAADSLELLSDYETFKRLSGTIDLSKYNKDFTDYTTEYKAELRESYSLWWSEDETKKIEKISKLLEGINKEEHIFRISINKDHNNLYIFSDSTYAMYLGERERAQKRLHRKE